jgi:V/A-type H+-transporting ATPase subunit E
MAVEQRALKNAHNEEVEPSMVESAGVEGLIRRLREEGIAKGQSEAGAILAAAQLEAADLVAQAGVTAESIVAAAKAQAEKVKAGGEDAVKLAMRDTILALEGDMLRAFSERLRRLVSGVLAEPAFLQRLILQVAGRATRGVENGEILLPAEMVSLDDLQKKPESVEPGTLMHFVLSLGGEELREGMRFGVANDEESGIRVRVAGDDLQIDLTESAVHGLLLQHLLPRYRALLRGAVAGDARGGMGLAEKKAAVAPAKARARR